MFVLHLVWLVIVAHYSLPRAVNVYNLQNLRRKRVAKFYQYSPVLYCWPLVPCGVYSLVFDYSGWLDSHTLGWIWSATLLIVLLTLAIDISIRGMTMFVLGLLTTLFGFWLLEANLGVNVFVTLGDIFRWMDVRYPRGLVLLSTSVVAISYAVMLGRRRFDSVLTIQGDTLTVTTFGVTSDTYQRGGWQFKSHFNDMLEYLIGGGAGELSIVNPQSKAVLVKASHVPAFRKIAKAVEAQFAITDVVAGHERDLGDEAAAH